MLFTNNFPVYTIMYNLYDYECIFTSMTCHVQGYGKFLKLKILKQKHISLHKSIHKNKNSGYMVKISIFGLFFLLIHEDVRL